MRFGDRCRPIIGTVPEWPPGGLLGPGIRAKKKRDLIEIPASVVELTPLIQVVVMKI